MQNAKNIESKYLLYFIALNTGRQFQRKVKAAMTPSICHQRRWSRFEMGLQIIQNKQKQKKQKYNFGLVNV